METAHNPKAGISHNFPQHKIMLVYLLWHCLQHGVLISTFWQFWGNAESILQAEHRLSFTLFHFPMCLILVTLGNSFFINFSRKWSCEPRDAEYRVCNSNVNGACGTKGPSCLLRGLSHFSWLMSISRNLGNLHDEAPYSGTLKLQAPWL